MVAVTDEASDGYFGLCPKCHKSDGYINVGRNHWGLCEEHRTKWCIGSNLFSSWRDEHEAEQRRQYNALRFGTFEEVVPYRPMPIEASKDEVLTLDPFAQPGWRDEFVTALKAALFHLEDGQSEPEDFHEAMKVLHRFTDWQHRPPFPF
jgi:hypothetical protein